MEHHPTPPAASAPLHCAIIGAGIAGLAAAIALRRAGHTVSIYEKSTFKNEIGAAITLTPNAMLVLDAWGFDAARAHETDKLQFRRMDEKSVDEPTGQHSFAGVRERYRGHNFNAFHRVDLHEGMREMVRGLGVEVELGREVVGVECETGMVRFKGGEEVERDLVVIADGIKSRFVSTITETDIPTKKTGKSVYRTLIPMATLLADPLVAPLFADQPSGHISAVNRATGTLLVTYPCRSETEMNVAIFHSTRPHQADAEDWNSPATVQGAVDALEGYHPAWRKLVGHAESIKCYTVGHRDVLPRMTRGRAVIIGDAAHPMQPTHAQGGSLSLEDAAALSALFAPSTPSSAVPARLALFNALRLPRCNVTQLLSNAMFFSLIPSAQNLEQQIRRYWSGPLMPEGTPDGWSEPIREFFFRMMFLGRRAGRWSGGMMWAGCRRGGLGILGGGEWVGEGGWAHTVLGR